MVLQVHDELIFEMPEDELADAAKHSRAACRTSSQLRVPLTVDLKQGRNWAEHARRFG